MPSTAVAIGDSRGKATPDEIRLIENAASCGVTWDELHKLFDVKKSVFKQFEKKNPEIHDKYHNGLVKAGMRVGARLLQKAEQGDMTAIRYWENTRRGITTDMVQQEVNVVQVVAAPAKVSRDEWVELYGKKDTVGVTIENPTQEELNAPSPGG